VNGLIFGFTGLFSTVYWPLVGFLCLQQSRQSPAHRIEVVNFNLYSFSSACPLPSNFNVSHFIVHHLFVLQAFETMATAYLHFDQVLPAASLLNSFAIDFLFTYSSDLAATPKTHHNYSLRVSLELLKLPLLFSA
jgi:hypothetical protein